MGEALIKKDKSALGHNLARPVFVDSEDLRDLRDLKRHVMQSHNLVLLLTNGVLRRPWCLIEIVTAMSYNVNFVPVEIQHRAASFRYPDEAYYQRLLQGEEIDDGGVDLLESQGFDLKSVESAIRQVFNHIALPFSPHKTALVRDAELMVILKHCQMRS